MKFEIYTGRTHQIRVHSKNIGHPIVCDPIYGDGKPVFLSSIKRKYKLSKTEEEEKPILNRIALHSHILKLKTEDGLELNLISELPKDIKALTMQLKKNYTTL